MRRRGLKMVRVVGAVSVFAGLTAALIDFRGAVPAAVGHWLASAQLVPSALALVTGVSVALAALVVLVVTLAVGRVYCSVLCPLGILQDIVARIAGWIQRGRRRLRPSSALTWVRQLFMWGTGAGIIAAGAGFTLSWLDPYSIYGRIASDLFRPAAVMLNNRLVGLVGRLGFGADSLYPVNPPWPETGALAGTAIMLMLVAGLAAWRGRLYCNTVCPVGTLLGLVSARSAWQLSLDQAACRKCGDCLRVCKAQCIDLRHGSIDHSRCVDCYNCVSACADSGISYRWTWRRGSRPPPASVTASAVAVENPSRRTFLAVSAAAVTFATGSGSSPAAKVVARIAGRASVQPGESTPLPISSPNASSAICPPGAASVDHFLTRCTACHLCVSACPTHVLQPAFLQYGIAGMLKPRLDYADAFCNFDCRRCEEVCPDGALALLPLSEKQVTRIGAASLNLDNCIVKTKGTDCAACSEHCPTKAVDTVPYGTNLRLPQVNPDLCIGCGACEYACPAKPSKAITVAGRRRHERAERRVEEKARDPRKQSGFPF